MPDKGHSSCVICGNGPSLLCDEVLGGANDLFLINTGIFLSATPALYFYERFGLRSGNTTHGYGIENYLQSNFDFEAIQRIIFYEMGRIAAKVIAQNSIIINPNQPDLGYTNPIPELGEGLSCKYFSFNEEDVDMFGLNLLHYFRDLFPRYVLNFRGSIVRALSMALSMGYETIFFAGIDPSQYSWWWEDERAWQFLRPSVRHLRDHFKAVRQLRPDHLVKYDSEAGPWEAAPMSWCLRKTLLAAKKVYSEHLAVFPEIRLIGRDPIAIAAFNGII